MDVRADLLSGLRRSKNPNDRQFGSDDFLFILAITGDRELGVEDGWRCLVVVDAIDPDTEGVHEGFSCKHEEYMVMSM